MRAGPLSNDAVISLLNRHFVPVYVVNEDYRKRGPAPAEEKAEMERIYRAALAAGHSTGTVHVYLLSADGDPLDTLHVAEAAKTGRLLALLERTVEKLGLPEAPHQAEGPLVEPAPQSAPPPGAAGGGGAEALVLHLFARGTGRGSWREFPAEDWIVLDAAEWRKALPPGGAGAGTRWDLDRELSRKLLTRFYPQTENNDLSTNRIELGRLTGELVSAEGSRAHVRLHGELRMGHAFYPGREDRKTVEATLLGCMELDRDAGRILSLRLATVEAVYAGEPFTAALFSSRFP